MREQTALPYVRQGASVPPISAVTVKCRPFVGPRPARALAAPTPARIEVIVTRLAMALWALAIVVAGLTFLVRP